LFLCNYLITISYTFYNDSRYIYYSKDGSTWEGQVLKDENDKPIDLSRNYEQHSFVYDNKLIFYFGYGYDIKFYNFSFDDYKCHTILDPQTSEKITTSDDSRLIITAFYPYATDNIVIAVGQNTSSSNQIFISNDLIFWQVIHTPFTISDLLFDGHKIMCKSNDKTYFLKLH
jgi:hypothetical protein